MRRIAVIVAAVLLLSAPCTAFTNEPKGFQGWNWGMSVADAAPWMNYNGAHPIWRCEIYEAISPEFRGGSIRALYQFYKNELVGVTTSTTSTATGEIWYQETIERFGLPTEETDTSSRKLTWIGDEAVVLVEYGELKGVRHIRRMEMFTRTFYDLWLMRTKSKGGW